MKAKLNARFYIAAVLLFVFVAVAWYGVYFLMTNDISVGEDSVPMNGTEKTVLAVISTLVGLSWTFSLVTVLGIAARGCGFIMDESGIRSTASITVFLAFIFVVPIKHIPYSALSEITFHDDTDKRMVTARLDKEKAGIPLLLRPLVPDEYHFFAYYTTAKTDEIMTELKKHIEK
ncbi:MAG: hypothetical protein KBT31_04730 [Firmicutes bacterium]|nr:hypothetical protein [Candidatus Colimorpha enterica]